MKRFLVATAIVALGTAGAGVSLADPGPNGHNNHGLCTAYEHNNDNAKKSPPFQALEKAASDGDSSTSPSDDVAKYCEAYLGGNSQNGNGNGNPSPGGK